MRRFSKFRCFDSGSVGSTTPTCFRRAMVSAVCVMQRRLMQMFFSAAQNTKAMPRAAGCKHRCLPGAVCCQSKCGVCLYRALPAECS